METLSYLVVVTILFTLNVFFATVELEKNLMIDLK